MLRLKAAFTGLLLVLVCSVPACDFSYYNPHPFRKKLSEERQLAHRTLAKLTAEGELPVAASGGGAGGALSEADEKYATLCAQCHGVDGHADTPAALALNPRPRAFTDAGWQEKTSDERIAKVVREGGAAVGLSPSMAPWGAMLSAEQVQGLVQKIRQFKK